MQQRDNQRQRLYNAENSVFKSGQTIPNEGLQAYVNRVLDTRPVRSRWGVRNVRVEMGRNRGTSYGGWITLGIPSRNEWVILHELAHELTPRDVGHGPEFAGVYLFLVETMLGKETAARLKAAFKEKRVKVSRKGIPAVRREVPASQAVRDREERKRRREAALNKVAVMLERGELTKADLRRLAA